MRIGCSPLGRMQRFHSVDPPCIVGPGNSDGIVLGERLLPVLVEGRQGNHAPWGPHADVDRLELPSHPILQPNCSRGTHFGTHQVSTCRVRRRDRAEGIGSQRLRITSVTFNGPDFVSFYISRSTVRSSQVRRFLTGVRALSLPWCCCSRNGLARSAARGGGAATLLPPQLRRWLGLGVGRSPRRGARHLGHQDRRIQIRRLPSAPST